jgi:hypothetical protein
MGNGRGRGTTGDQGGADPVAAMAARIEGSWRELTDALAGIPEERLAEPGAVGEWSVKDLLGHVAVWDDHAVASCRRLLAGEPGRPVEWQALNEREAAKRRGRSVAEQRAEMEAAHARLLAFVRGLSPAERRIKGVRPRLRFDTYAHYPEHAAQVRAWRERVGV